MCDTWYSLKRASCVGRHLYNIDAGAPNNVQALDLSDNVISFLNSFELKNAELTKLRYLNLSKNAISEISLNAFDGLTDLTVLDLSKNRLHYILDEVFEKNENLRILKLSNNNFNSHIPKLRSFSLMELTLDSCRISHLPLDTFNGLTHIRRLDLSNNLMIQMSNTVVQTLHFLKKLSLEGNPWSCNNVLHDLQIYLKYKNIEFNEICGKKNNSQKFEKMILLPVTISRNYHHSAIVNTSTKKIKSITKYNISNILNNKNLSICEQMINQTHIINSTDKFVSYWFLCLGFIAGISSGLIISYIWLSKKYLYNPRYCYHRQLHDDLIVSQRVSLLNSFLQGRTDSNGSLIESCPGTPPPPYRDVILRPTLYRYPSVVSNLNNNDTRYRERYT
ncbi:leucine-rich repeat-containing protein 4C-like isoform X2 [Apis laboriosa]|nr:leucine-rich repeat-containing protein 4C-like isoform X2 [Apis laboriosa]XP_043787983.1 leucine-rich repeat-containing protein 4C-like isoform X2 [Apis laboriosa]XP_043787984.1 leucine-rich repeat-containing protein 4C-like isoform X2 [Apis laboriosa]